MLQSCSSRQSIENEYSDILLVSLFIYYNITILRYHIFQLVVSAIPTNYLPLFQNQAILIFLIQSCKLGRETLKMKIVLGLELFNLLPNTARIIYANTYGSRDIFHACRKDMCQISYMMQQIPFLHTIQIKSIELKIVSEL
tara:strand:- start:130 stop:552 length:423 start_codon:yes stop_codon:yes gene_type:complete